MSGPTVWVFNGAGARLPSGAFSSRATAEAWIAEHRLSGLLTEYPLDQGAFEWAVERGAFTPKTPEHRSPAFIGGFSSASLAHLHYHDGVPHDRDAD